MDIVACQSDQQCFRVSNTLMTKIRLLNVRRMLLVIITNDITIVDSSHSI